MAWLKKRLSGGLGLAILSFAALLSGPSATKEADPAQTELLLRKYERTAFLQHEVNPILESTFKKNLDAIERAKETLRRSLDRYRFGIEPFIGDVRSWSTEYGVITQSATDLWYQDGRLDRFMEDKFAAHLFTEVAIRRDLEYARRQFIEDLEASQNQLLIELSNASTSFKMKAPPVWPDAATFSQAVSTKAITSVENSTVKFIVLSKSSDVIIPIAVATIVQQAVRSIATRAATIVLARAGALAAGAGEGGTAGSEFPVIGTILGIGAGLAASYFAGNYEQQKADEELRRNIISSIEDLKAGVIGTEASPSDIVRSMNDYVKQVDEAERDLITQDVVAISDGPAK